MPTYYMKNPDVVLREEDASGGLVFNPDTNFVQVLNKVGLYIWKACDGTVELNTLVEKVKKEFDDVPSDVDEDITQFIDNLVRFELVGVVQ